MDTIEKRHKNFPFLYEIEFERFIVGFLLKERKEEIKKRGEYVLKNSRDENLKELTKILMEFLELEYKGN